MLKYFARRIFNLATILLVMSLAAFMVVRLIPGDPIMAMLGDRRVTKETIDNMRHLYGLDIPIWKQYLNYIMGLFQGNFGLSYFRVGEPVIDIIGRAFTVTLTVSLISFPVVIIFGILIGMLAAFYKNSIVDTIISFVTVLVTAIPNIAIGAMLIYVFALKLHLFPVSGWGGAKELVLPVFLVALYPTFSLARQTRACLIEELNKCYILTARAKGLSEFGILLKHAFRNVLLPVSTKVGMMFGGLLEGSFITEIIFNIPGLGRVSVDSIFRRDYPVVVAVILLATLIYGLTNIFVDLGYWVFNPKVREGMFK